MTDVVTLFTDKHSGQSFSDFDECTDAHVSTEYKHMKKYFWSGELPRMNAATVNRNRRIAREICSLYDKRGSRAANS